MATLLFLILDGHLMILQVLADSFTAIPVGPRFLNPEIFWNITLYSAQMFITAVLLALPVMVGVLLINMGFVVMMRAAPQLNVFAMGFPITLLTGFVLMFLSYQVLLPVLTEFMNTTFAFLIAEVN